MPQLERDAAVTQAGAQGGPRVDEGAVFGPDAPARTPRAKPPVDALDDAPCLSNFVRRALRKVLLAKALPGAEEHHVVRRGLEILLAMCIVVALTDVEDIAILLSRIRGLTLFGLFLGRVGWWALTRC